MANPTYVFGAADAKIYPLLTDTSGGATYGTSLDIPGLKSISIAGKSNTKELRGDHKLLEKISILESVEVTLEFAKWDADVYALFTGATKDDLGDGAYFVSLGSDSKPGYFKLSAVSYGATGTGANVEILLPKLIVTDLPDMVGLSEEDFKTVSIKAEALPLATGDWLGWGYNPEGTILS